MRARLLGTTRMMMDSKGEGIHEIFLEPRSIASASFIEKARSPPLNCF